MVSARWRTELAEGPTVCSEVAMGGCSFAWNFSVTRSTVLTVAEEENQTKHDAGLVTST